MGSAFPSRLPQYPPEERPRITGAGFNTMMLAFVPKQGFLANLFIGLAATIVATAGTEFVVQAAGAAPMHPTVQALGYVAGSTGAIAGTAASVSTATTPEY
jgi:hypothetical protein